MRTREQKNRFEAPGSAERVRGVGVRGYSLTAAFVFCFVLIPLSSHAELSSEDAGFSRAEQTPTKSKIQMEINPGAGIEGGTKDAMTMEKIDIRLEGFSSLITAERDSSKRADMHLSRAVLHLQKAHALESTSDSKQDVSQHLKSAQEDATTYLRSPIITPSGKAYALYLLGLVFVERSMRPQAADYFEQSLETWGEASYSSAIIFYLADYLERSDKITRSIGIYKKYMHNLSPSEQTLANYKMAWAYISLRKLKAAELILVEMVKQVVEGESQDMAVGRTAIKDLAYVSSEIRTERETLLLADRLFGDNVQLRLEFLSSAYSNLQRARPGKVFPVVFGALLKLASTSEKRVGLWLAELKAGRQEHAARAPLVSFKALRSELESAQGVGSFQDEIEVEVSHLIRSYLDTYTERSRNAENLSKKEIADGMLDLFRFFDRYYPKNSKRIAMYQLWFDLCAAEANHACALEVSENVSKDKSLQRYAKRASVEKIIALNALSRSVDKKYKDELILSLERYVENQESPRWAEFADLLANLYISYNQSDKSLRLLDEVLSRSPTELSFYRLQLARFKFGRYEELLGATPPNGVELTARHHELAREASLKLAIQNEGEKGDFAKYEANIMRFLRLNQDKSKAAVVLAEYLRALIRKGQQARAIEKLAEVEPSVRGDVRLAPLLEELMQFSLVQARYDWIQKITPDSDQETSPKVKYLSVVARLVVEKIFDRPRFSQLTKEQKVYLLQLLSLVSPDQVIDYLAQFGDAESSEVRRAGVLAFQVKENTLLPYVNQVMSRALLDQLPPKWLVTPLTDSEKVALKASKNKMSNSNRQRDLMIQREIAEIRKTRSMVKRDLKGKDASTRVRILETLQTAELRVSESVLQTSIPPKLSVAAKKKFVGGLEKTSRDFRDQAAQYELALQKDRVLAEKEQARNNRMPADFNVAKSAMPRTPTAVRISQIANSQGVLASLVTLDVLKETQRINKVEHQKIKSGLILRMPANLGRYSFAQEMLKQSGRAGEARGKKK